MKFALLNHEHREFPELLLDLHLVVAAGPVDGAEDPGLRWDSLQEVVGCFVRQSMLLEYPV